MTTKRKIRDAEKAAERFLETVHKHHKRYHEDPHYAKFCEITGFRETASMRRASMELTRALAEMRKP
jgi:hypothetical protein